MNLRAASGGALNHILRITVEAVLKLGGFETSSV
jgi:hypothetical protein